MDFSTAIKTCFSKYLDFTGRAKRPEYWYFVLFTFVVSMIIGFVSSGLSILFSLGVLLPSLGAGARRLHDTGRSAWWLLIGLIPLIGAIVLIVFMAQEGQTGENAYGPEPAL